MASCGFSLSVKRLPTDCGIAIGPILFIIAVLGVLASAIAASSGSFSTSTTSTSADVKASALIEVGQNLKLGFERIAASVPYASIGMTGTTVSTDLFSPSGGGITKPSTSIDFEGSLDIRYWLYADVTLPDMKIGSGTSPNRMAFYKVSEEICQSLNKKLRGTTDIPSIAFDPYISSGAHTDSLRAGAIYTMDPWEMNWQPEMEGKLSGCFFDADDGDSWQFYQVLGVQ